MLDGIEATRRIVAEVEGVAVVILTSFSDRERILRALDAGAVGYLLKDAEPDELLRGIHAAARGESPLAPKAANAILRARSEQQTVTLSSREREVLVCVAEGLQNKLIARRLGIAEKTVKSHLTSVFAQIGVTDRTQAALWARRNGVVWYGERDTRFRLANTILVHDGLMYVSVALLAGRLYLSLIHPATAEGGDREPERLLEDGRLAVLRDGGGTDVPAARDRA